MCNADLSIFCHCNPDVSIFCRCSIARCWERSASYIRMVWDYFQSQMSEQEFKTFKHEVDGCERFRAVQYQVGHANFREMSNGTEDPSPAGCPMRELSDTGFPLRTEFWYSFPGKHTKSPTIALPWHTSLEQASYWGHLNSKWNDRRGNFTGTDATTNLQTSACCVVAQSTLI